MADQNYSNEFDNENAEEVRITDKRRINANGELNNMIDEEITTDAPNGKQTQPNVNVQQLEATLTEERTRREAAEKKLIEVQARFEEVKNNLERETAEMRERMRKSLEERAKQSQSNFLTALMPVVDNLNLAIKAAESGTTAENLLAGLRGTASGFDAALSGVGVEPIAAVGATFDPELHEAVDIVAVNAEQDNIVTAEYSRGYRFGERLLRPARVQVGRAAAQAEAAAE